MAVSTPDQFSGPIRPNHLLDAGHAAELLAVPKTWILAEARADRIPHIRLGRYVRFDAEALQEWWRQRARGPHPDRSTIRMEAA